MAKSLQHLRSAAAENLIRLYEAQEQFDSATPTIQHALKTSFTHATLPDRHQLLLAEARILRKQKKYNEAIFQLVEKIKILFAHFFYYLQLD